MLNEECNHETCSHRQSRGEIFYHHCSDKDCDNYIKNCPVHSHSGICANLP